jgi:hypothetical protein
MVVIKGRRPGIGVENEGYDTDEDSDDEGNVRSLSDESNKVSVEEVFISSVSGNNVL